MQTNSNPTAVGVADEVRAHMARRRVSQATVAKSLECSQSALSRRLRGEIPFNVAELGRLAVLFDIPLAELVTTPERAAS